MMRVSSGVVGLVVVMVMAVIEEGSGPLTAGTAAPQFAARLNSGEEVRLSDYRAKSNVVLFFYPKDFSTGCTRQVCQFRDSYDEIRSLNAVILGVSADNPDSHDRFADRYRLPFSLISDADGTLSKAYGVRRLGGLVPLVKRVTYVIDREGIIRLTAHHEFAIGRHVEEVLKCLRKLQ